MRAPVRVLLAGVAVLLATLGPAASSSAQEPPPPSSIAAIGDSISQAFDVCCFYGTGRATPGRPATTATTASPATTSASEPRTRPSAATATTTR